MTGTGSLRGSSFRLPCKRTTASSRLTSLRLRHRPTDILRPLFLSFSVFLHRLPTLCSPSSRSDPMRAFALAPLSSPLVHPTDRPVDHFSLSIVIYPVSSRLLHERVATRAKRGPPPSSFFAASLRDADAMLFSRLHHSATRAQQRLSPPLFLSFSSREAEVMPRIRFFILPPPFLLPPFSGCPVAVVSFSSFSLYLVVCSVIGSAIRVDTQLFIPHDVGSPRIGRTGLEDKRMNAGFE